MAEGVFTIEADITPVLDEAALTRQVEGFSRQFNNLLAKGIKPIPVATDSKSFSQSQTFAQKIISQLNILNSETGTFNKTLTTTANIFDSISRAAVDVVKRGIQPIAQEVQKLAPAVTSVFRGIRSVAGTAFDLGKAGILQFSNAINLTNTNILGYAGNIRKAIQENGRFKDALIGIRAAGGTLSSLPSTFQNLQASVVAGVSPLQRAAEAGSGLSRSLVPFLVLGVAVAREISAISASIRTLVVDSGSLADKIVPLPKRVEAAFASFGKDGPAARKAVEDLKTAIPGLSDALDKLVVESRGAGIGNLREGIKGIRDEFTKTELLGQGLVGIIKRLFTTTDFTEAKAKVLELNRALLDLGADKGEVPFFKRLTISAQNSFETIENLIKRVQPQLTTLAGQVAAASGPFASQGAASVKSSGILSGQQNTPPPQPTLPIAAPPKTGVISKAVEAEGQATLEEFKTLKELFDAALKKMFTDDSTVVAAAKAEGKKIGDQLQLGLTERQFKLPAPKPANFENIAKQSAEIFQGGFEKRLTGIQGKVDLPGALGLNAKNVEAATGKIAASATGGLVNGFKNIGGTIKGLIGGGLGGLKDAVGGIAGQLGLGSIATLGFVGALVGLGTAALNAAAKFEKIRVALDGITGGNGKQALEDLANFAAVTPFRLETAANAAIKLQSTLAGLDTKGAISILTVFSSAAAAVGATDDAMQRALLGFTQIQAAGKLTADNVRQITEALPNISQTGIITELGKNMGISTDQARKLYQDGLVPVKNGLQAIAAAAASVPGATEALKNQSLTFQGLLSTTKDQTEQLLAAIGGPLLGVAVIVLKGLNAILTLLYLTVKNIGPAIDKLKGFLAGLVDESRTYNGLLAKVADALEFFREKIANVSIAGLRLGEILANLGNGVRGLIGWILGTGDSAGTTAPKIQSLSDALKDAERQLDPLTRAQDAFIKSLSSGDIKKQSDALLNLEEAQKSATDNLLNSETDILKKVIGVKSALDAQKQAALAVTNAQQALTDAVVAHDKELSDKSIELEKKLAEQRLATVDANQKAEDAQKKLDEALHPDVTEDAEKADLALSTAKLRLRQLIEDEKKAQDELNKTHTTGIDLTGLSIDQIKTRLSVFKASLAAQKALTDKQAADAKKTPEQKAIDDNTAVITRRQAELDILDATKAVETLRAKGSEKDPEVIAARQAVAEATKQAAKALDDQKATQIEIDKLHGPDLEFAKQKKGLETDITNAKVAARDADRQAAIAIAEAKGDKAEIVRLLGQEIKDTPGLTKILQDATIPTDTRLDLETRIGIQLGKNKGTLEETISTQTRLNDAINAALASGVLTEQQANVAKLTQAFSKLKPGELPTGRQDIDAFIKAALSQTANGKSVQDLIDNVIKNLINKNFGGKNTLLGPEAIKLFNNEAVKAVTLALADGEKSQDEINTAIKEALKRIPGIGPLKFAQGAVVDKATPGIFGESGREVILPLTRPARLMDLLSHPQVLPPVLDALGRITLPRSSSPMLDANQINSPLSKVNMVRSAPQVPPAHEQNKRDAALAKAIVAEMQSAGFTGGKQITVQNDFTAPNADDPLSVLQIRKIARQVKQEIEKEW